MIISRGSGSVSEAKGPKRADPAPRVAAIRTPANDPPAADHALVHHRLAALERLTALLDKGVLTQSEFTAEKALVLRLPAEELILRAGLPPSADRGPSLLGRLFGWKLLVPGAALGFALSWYSDPDAFLRLAGQLGRLVA